MALVPAQTKLLHISRSLRPTSLAIFRAILPDKTMTAYCRKSGVNFRHQFFTPVATFWALIAQCLDPDHSCRSAVAYMLSWWRSGKAPLQRRNRKRGEPSQDTGAYCKARKRLPEELVAWAMRHTGQSLDKRVAAGEKVWGKDVYLVDGTCVSMPDEKALAEEFGRSGGGKGGAKKSVFPIGRLVAFVSLATGAVVDAALGAYKASEHALFHAIWSKAAWLCGAVIVGDRLFGSYTNMAQLHQAEVDMISRLHGRRPADMRQGKCLGKGDRLVTWHRPKKNPKWLGAEAQLPETITLRMIRVRSLLRGFRPKNVILITTLTDAEIYKADDIANLYFRRWEIEVDLRHIKSVMQMDVLRGKTPDIVRKEIWAHMAAYNLVRTVTWEAAASHDFSPWGLEFQGHTPAAQYLRSMHRKRPLFELLPETVQGDA